MDPENVFEEKRAELVHMKGQDYELHCEKALNRYEFVPAHFRPRGGRQLQNASFHVGPI